VFTWGEITRGRNWISPRSKLALVSRVAKNDQQKFFHLPAHVARCELERSARRCTDARINLHAPKKKAAQQRLIYITRAKTFEALLILRERQFPLPVIFAKFN
jgi:hypothetical protein